MMQEWFRAAKFGIFVHWGIYAVGEVEASWSFFQHGTPEAVGPARQWMEHGAYMKLAAGFGAERFDARAWAELFKSVGARYAVLTAKHHDGVALWPTAQGELSTARMTPSGAVHPDIVGEYCAALREAGLHVGIYYSHADWTHPDYASVWKEGFDRGQVKAGPARFSYPQGAEDPAAWRRFLAFHRAQLKELCERYSPELLWFDGEWERSPSQWNMAALMREVDAWRPGVVKNDRCCGQGDYEVAEQGMPVHRPAGLWEFCATINHQWGYTPENGGLKAAHELSRMLMETVGMGGNFLLNIGPRPDGTFDPQQRERLEELGAWVRRNAEAIFETQAGLPPEYVYGASTISNDRRTVYVCMFDWPVSGMSVKGIRNKVTRVRVVGQAGELRFHVNGGAPWLRVPGVLWIEGLPEFDRMGTVVAIELDGPLDLWDGRTLA